MKKDKKSPQHRDEIVLSFKCLVLSWEGGFGSFEF